MLCREGIVSLIAFIGSIIGFLTPAFSLLFIFDIALDSILNGALYVGGVLSLYVIICFVSYISNTEADHEIIIRASLIGFVFGVGVFLLTIGAMPLKHLGAYICLIAFFHFTEFLAIAYSNPRSLNIDTFMLNHSVAYAVAAVFSWTEYTIEAYFYPPLKDNLPILCFGVVICVAGELLRKSAIITANSNFNHIVQYQKAQDHSLVTHGVYAYMRHPSYAGWFWWSIGTQIVLCNPVCIVFYAIASWKFFHERIFVEEMTLIGFFQQEYVEYQRRVGTGVPFIKGFTDHEVPS